MEDKQTLYSVLWLAALVALIYVLWQWSENGHYYFKEEDLGDGTSYTAFDTRTGTMYQYIFDNSEGRWGIKLEPGKKPTYYAEEYSEDGDEQAAENAEEAANAAERL